MSFTVRLNYSRPRKRLNNAKSGTDEYSRFKFIISVSSVSINNITPPFRLLVYGLSLVHFQSVNKLVSTPFCIYLSKQYKFFVFLRYFLCVGDSLKLTFFAYIVCDGEKEEKH